MPVTGISPHLRYAENAFVEIETATMSVIGIGKRPITFYIDGKVIFIIVGGSQSSAEYRTVRFFQIKADEIRCRIGNQTLASDRHETGGADLCGTLWHKKYRILLHFQSAQGKLVDSIWNNNFRILTKHKGSVFNLEIKVVIVRPRCLGFVLCNNSACGEFQHPCAVLYKSAGIVRTFKIELRDRNRQHSVPFKCFRNCYGENRIFPRHNAAERYQAIP